MDRLAKLQSLVENGDVIGSTEFIMAENLNGKEVYIVMQAVIEAQNRIIGQCVEHLTYGEK